MSADLYHEIYTGEIFQKSNCIWHENTIMDFFRSNLKLLGYVSIDSGSNKVWQRGDRRVVICLVDDFSTCVDDYQQTAPYQFDKNTTVITDNYISCPTQYQVLQVPPSFYGIYAHEPEVQDWEPERRFNFSVNRLDGKRLLLFLELQYRASEQLAQLDYINFNCWRWGGDNNSANGLIENFKTEYNNLDPQYKEVYDNIYNKFVTRMPYRNHELSQETAHNRAWFNIVVETYSSDTSIALSEKIFRALCMPSPWMVYSGKNTVAYLHSLGFDVLRDIVEHRYDNAIEMRTAAYGDKMVDFYWEGNHTMRELQKLDQVWLKERCRAAATHNQKLLRSMQLSWPTDFANWWADVAPKL